MHSLDFESDEFVNTSRFSPRHFEASKLGLGSSLLFRLCVCMCVCLGSLWVCFLVVFVSLLVTWRSLWAWGAHRGHLHPILKLIGVQLWVARWSLRSSLRSIRVVDTGVGNDRGGVGAG